MKKLAIASAVIFASWFGQNAMANIYHAEVKAALGYVDPDHGSSGSEYKLQGKYFFNPVETRDSPLAESAFLDRASNISVHGDFSNRGDTDENSYGAELEVFVPRSDFYASAGFKQNNEKHKVNGFKHHWDTTYYNAEIGYLPTAGLLIAAGVEGFDNDQDTGIDPTIRAKYITQVAGKDLNLEAGIAFGDLDEYHLEADYYLNKTFSVGADYSDNDVDEVSEFGFKARKFFTHQLSLEGRVGFGKEFNNDYNSFDLTARYHF